MGRSVASQPMLWVVELMYWYKAASPSSAGKIAREDSNGSISWILERSLVPSGCEDLYFHLLLLFK